MALIPPTYLNSVVCIGVAAGDEPDWVASGFFYGDRVSKDHVQSGYRVYLVTNRHVFQGKERIVVRLNPTGTAPAVEFPVQLVREGGDRIWFDLEDEAIDLALIHVDAPGLREQGIDLHYFRSDQNVLARPAAKAAGITEGDGVFALGFPLRLVGGLRNFAILRQGAIARISDALDGQADEYLLDMFVFPGNSGGPVVVQPSAVAIEGTQAMAGSYLIAVVKGYISYEDTAVSTQTWRPRITFEENSGLASAIPIDFVKLAIDGYLAKHVRDEFAA